MSVLFVGDVHLTPRGADKNRRFLDFLDRKARTLDSLYLLGDIFDYWIGPKHLDSADYRAELDALGALSRAGVRLFWIHGNRDYLIEARFALRTGVRILGDGARLELGGRAVWAAHGDLVYNRNPDYAAYRRLMNFPLTQSIWMAVPAMVGKSVARGFKVVSKKTTTPYRWTRDDLVRGARRIFERGAEVFICGHIHLPQHVPCDVGGRRRDIYVLGDWDGTAEVVEFDGGDWRFGAAV